MNITNRTTHAVQQRTGPWLRLREGFRTASEAPSALGVGRYTTRADLLRQKHTGVAPEHSPATLGKFAAGHASEDAARPLAEAIVGEELFPTTMSALVDGMPLLASLDGQTMLGDVIWETKLWNEELAAAVQAADDGSALEEYYKVQMDQELVVSGAERCLFTCTDGTAERLVHCWYRPDPARFAALVHGWRQFERDLASYVLPETAEPAPVGRSPETLPALRIELSGAVTASNLDEFKATALGAIRSVNRDLRTDADFADAEKAVKWCADLEARLNAAKEHALSQTADIDALFRALEDIGTEARTVRLDLDRLVTRRKAEVKERAVAAARADLGAHIAAIHDEIAPMRIPEIQADFGAAIKGLKTMASVQDKLAAALAAAKIDADAAARVVRGNLAAYGVAAAGLEFLFWDLATLINKAPDDFRAAIDARIAQHKAAEAERERKRLAAEELAAQEAESARLEALASENRARMAAEQVAHHVLHGGPAPAGFVQPVLGRAVEWPAEAPARASAPTPDEPATLKLGTICDRLGFVLSASFVADVLHIKPSRTDGRAVMFTETQYRAICSALISHVQHQVRIGSD